MIFQNTGKIIKIIIQLKLIDLNYFSLLERSKLYLS